VAEGGMGAWRGDGKSEQGKGKAKAGAHEVLQESTGERSGGGAGEDGRASRVRVPLLRH
jgi:hypothetical protein